MDKKECNREILTKAHLKTAYVYFSLEKYQTQNTQRK